MSSIAHRCKGARFARAYCWYVRRVTTEGAERWKNHSHSGASVDRNGPRSVRVGVVMSPLFKNDVERWRAHLAAERDAQGLYLALAQADRNGARAAIWRELAAVEERHGQRWVEKLQAAGAPVPPAGRLGWRPRVLGLVARIAGPRAVLPIVTAM